MTLGEPDETGRRRPIPLQGSTFTIPAYTAVKAIGQQPRDEIDKWVEGLELDRGKASVDERGRTGNRKFFAGGDAINGGASVVEAVRDGKRAADEIDGSFDVGTDESVACPRRPGRQTGPSCSRSPCSARAAASRRSPNTGLNAEERRFAHTRGSPTGRSGATTRSSILTSSSSSSRRSSASRRDRGPRGQEYVLLNADHVPRSSRGRAWSASPRRGSPPSRARASATSSWSAPSPPRSVSRHSRSPGAAVDLLGGKLPPDGVRTRWRRVTNG